MNLTKENLEKIFSGVPKEKLAQAMKKADELSKNPEVRNSFSKISENRIKEILSALSGSDRQKILSAFEKETNKDMSELLKKLKNNL